MESYAVYDEFGLLSIGCMKCKTTVAKRTYVEVASKDNPSKVEKVLAMQRLGNWNRYRVTLSDDSYADLIVCTSCKNAIGETDYDHLENQLKLGWEAELHCVGCSEEKMKEHKEKVTPLKIRRK